MKKYRSFNFIFLLLGSLALLPSFAQVANKKDSAELKLRQAAFDIIKSTPYCALITLDKDGHPVARTMDPFFPDSNFVVWLGTNPRSRKVVEIKKDSTVCLYYGGSEVGYVIIQGTAQLVNDENEKSKRWKPGWSAFYKNKSTDYLLIKVMPLRLEVVNYKLNVVNDPVTWDVPFIKF